MMIPMLPELPELSRETIEAIIICVVIVASAMFLGWILADINDRKSDSDFEIENEELMEMLARRSERE